MELERAQAQSRELDLDWRRLQLDRAELTRNARVDRAARETLKLIPIAPERTIYMNQAPAAPGGAR
jgi:cell division protein FtsL